VCVEAAAAALKKPPAMVAFFCPVFITAEQALSPLSVEAAIENVFAPKQSTLRNSWRTPWSGIKPRNIIDHGVCFSSSTMRGLFRIYGVLNTTAARTHSARNFHI
jgi:hypothetical protein